MISISARQSFEAPAHGRPLAVRTSMVLAFVGVTLWSGSVACLRTNEAPNQRHHRGHHGRGQAIERKAGGQPAQEYARQFSELGGPEVLA